MGTTLAGGGHPRIALDQKMKASETITIEQPFRPDIVAKSGPTVRAMRGQIG